jgi:hypothetical protein
MTYENVKKVYGPYVGKDNRSRVVLSFVDGSKRTVSYPKFLMENYLGRKLTNNETVDHIDCDVTNNNIDNLRVIDRSRHVKLDAKRIGAQEFTCEVCQSTFTLAGRKLHDAKHNRDKGKKGPFCSRRCAGKASHSISSFQAHEVTVTHYTNKSLIEET